MIAPKPLPFDMPRPSKLAGLAIGVTALGLVGLLFTRDQTPVATVWLSNALILFALLRSSVPQWGPYLAAGLIGSLVARAAAGDPVSQGIAASGLNGLEVAICATLIRRLIGSNLDLTVPRHLAVFVLSAGGLAPAASGLLAAPAFMALTGAPALEVMAKWVPGHALGLLLLTPALLIIGTKGARELAREMAAPWHMGPALVLIASLAVVFGQTRYPLLFLLFPALTLIAFRWSGAWVAVALLLVTAVALGATIAGFGPAALIDGSQAERMVILQLFLATSTLVALSLTAVITSRRRTDQSLREAIAQSGALMVELADSERRYRLLAANASDLTACFDREARFTYLSPAIEPMLGYAPEELLGKQTREIMHPEDYRRSLLAYGGHVKSELAHEPFLFEYRAMHKDGREVWLSGHPRAVFDADGVIVEFQDTLRDITQRRALEAELAEARDIAEEAARVKADFLANMSHELRTPLTSIIGFTGLAAEQSDLADLTRNYIDRVSNASQALLCTVNDILDFSKLEAGQVTIHPEPVALAKLSRATLDLFAPQAGAKDLSLTLDTGEGGEELVVVIDPNRIRQILLNLVSNAVKFTTTGGVTLRTRYDRLAERLRIEIADTGAGLTAEQQSHLFKRFSQIDGSLTRTQSGTGLGLAICKGLAEAMGGDIGVESQAGKGSTFWFDVPAAPAVLAEAKSGAQISDEISFTGIRLLVADDNPANRELARLFLSGVGVEVSEAADGEEAARMAMEMPYDVILMDVQMPVLNGPGALRRIRESRGPNDVTPILAFTAEATSEVRARLLGLGFDSVVEKPVDPRTLITAVGRATAFSEQLRQTYDAV